MQSRCLNSLRCRGVLVRADDFLHLLRRHFEVRRASPYRCPLRIENGGFIDVAGADEARVRVVSM
jgi:hypothetical protein